MAEPRIVNCVKLGRPLPGMPAPPFPGELGRRIYENVSMEAWQLWQPYSTLLINHNGLSLANPQHRQFLMDQMEEFFFGGDAPMPEGWEPEGPSSPPTKGSKGGGAPRRK